MGLYVRHVGYGILTGTRTRGLVSPGQYGVCSSPPWIRDLNRMRPGVLPFLLAPLRYRVLPRAQPARTPSTGCHRQWVRSVLLHVPLACWPHTSAGCPTTRSQFQPAGRTQALFSFPGVVSPPGVPSALQLQYIPCSLWGASPWTKFSTLPCTALGSELHGAAPVRLPAPRAGLVCHCSM